MKTVLILTGALGLSASVASAECSYSKVTASVEVDRELKTASITKMVQTPAEQAMLLKTDTRAPAPAEVAK